jgi:endonuclease/exonuclease/phosphatase family metal-dependent hydrolase
MRFLWLLLLPLWVNALEFKVANYNVENLFDARWQGGEYEEYVPGNKHGWNEDMLRLKINHLSRVIGDIDADIIALEEVENEAVLERLNKALGDKAYPYVFYPKKKERVTIETALLSRFPIEKTQTFWLPDQARGIHKITLRIENFMLDVYANHWPAYKEREDERLVYAKTLHNLLEKEKNQEYIVLGDFNSPYEERKGHWGMGLVTFLKAGNKNAPLYNLWYELPQNKRYSHSYGREKETLDHIMIPKSLLDHQKIDYVKQSMKVFMPSYLLDEKGNPNRWQISDRGRGKHLGDGYSDHLPITAIFHTIKE